MKRDTYKYLKTWKNSKNRKPLVIRGARQVGKTWIVREFGRVEFENIVEINFDKHQTIADLFLSADVNTILRSLELELNIDIHPGKTLLFLDEIQSAPEILSRLRYFYEDIPDLHVVAAGSLLEFLIEDHTFSMPVGRIEYLFMGPMRFEEFLLALGENKLVDYLARYTFEDTIPESIHQKLLNFVKYFFIVGGMPAAVNSYRDQGNYREALREQQSILQTYVDDFSKYRKRVNARRLDMVFRRIPSLVGQKLKYVKIDRSEKTAALAQAIHLLELARVVYCVRHTAGNGLPFEAEVNYRNYKAIFLDIGLMQSALNLRYADIFQSKELIEINTGSLAEQFVGQHLLYDFEYFEKPSLYYWNRESKSSTAEIDYLLAHQGQIVPVEVKAGKTGKLRSLHLFVSSKKVDLAIKYSSKKPRCDHLHTIASNDPQPFTLLSIPFYLIDQTKRLLTEAKT